MRSTTTAKSNQESPAANSYIITPHDTNEVGTYLPRGIYVGVGGDLNVMLEGDEVATLFVGVPTGVILPLKVRIVLATSTTADSLVALY